VGAVGLIGLAALSRALRANGPIVAPAAMSRLAPLALALVFCSPAVWLGLPPLVLADGIRGLWAPAVTIGGAALALLLGAPWRVGGVPIAPSVLLRWRWPGARSGPGLAGATETAVAGLFVWAQFAAAREIGAMAGWPRVATIAVTLLVLGAALLPDLARVRLAALGGGVALVGLAVPLVVVAVGTTTAWPRVWGAVATRARIAFGEGSPWIREGGAVRGPAAAASLTFADEQRVVFGDRGPVFVEPREGGRIARDVEAGEHVVLHRGDRLVVPSGRRLRFEAGRRVPDAPDSGPEWVEPPSRSAGWLGLLALGVTGLLGAVGLPTGVAPTDAGRLRRRSGVLPGALALVAAGVALAVAWSLYAVWLIPEVYVGGVAGAEVYALPTTIPGSSVPGHVLAWLAFGGLTVGGAAAALVGVGGLRWVDGQPAARRAGHLRLGIVASAGMLACVAPAGAWTLLVLALGLAASGLAPTAVLARWSQRATARGAMAGMAAGLSTFLLVVVAGTVSPDATAAGWTGSILAGPAVLAVPVHFLVAGFLRARGPTSAQSLLTPPGLHSSSAPRG
jgi:hypothetical protein